MKTYLGLPAIVAAVVCQWPLQASAWHKFGHMATARIAYEQLNALQQKKLVQILRGHPRFADDFTVQMPPGLSPEAQDRWIVCQASIWPDLIRGNGLYDRPEWHYINYPFVLADAADRMTIETAAKAGLNLSEQAPPTETMKMNALQAIAFNSDLLKSAAATDAQKAVAACWLLHLIGDLHQPCHSTALFTKKLFSPTHRPHGDTGANAITFGTEKNDNLHFLWDEAPGSESANLFRDVETKVESLKTSQAGRGAAALTKTKPAEWAKESFDLAVESVYTQTIRDGILDTEKNGIDPLKKFIVDLPSDYKAKAAEVADKRVVEGGYRLAAHLASLL